MTTRRPFLQHLLTGLIAAFTALLAACAGQPGMPPSAAMTPSTPPPIVFVHGNGDTAALWITTLWRFESNGWPRERLHAVEMPYPQSRDDDTVAQAGRSSTEDQRAYLAAEVDKVLAATGAKQVVLMGNSRGGNAIRSYIAGGGAAKVSHAILGGTPNHGVWSNLGFRPRNEFNGAGPFLAGLNAPKAADGTALPAGTDGLEITPGPKWMTIRSDNNDKYAQPDGVWIGARGTPTNVSFDGPALKGAENIVLPGRDHRETAFHPEAFAAAYHFITGKAPAVDITPEVHITLDGQVTGLTAAGPTNLPLVGAQLAVWAVDATTGQRRGAALVDKTVGADGRWGPLMTDSQTPLEFVITAPGLATTHNYRSAFARSSAIVNLRPVSWDAADHGAAAVVSLVRPRGYFGLPRDSITLDGKSPPPGIPSGVAGVASSKLKLREVDRPVIGEFRSGVLAERIVGRTWPAAQQHVSVLELHD